MSAPALEAFFEEGWITEVSTPVKSGKEATVYCCQAGHEVEAAYLAAKVYRDREDRTFRNDAIYQAGRPILDKRLRRAVAKKTAIGVAWQFSAKDPETREKAALRFIAFSFFALAAYVSVDAILSLLGVGEARPSAIGIALATASLVIMPVLSLTQRRTGRELGSLSAVADSKQTLLCTYLSAVLLAGLVLNSLWGWSWADPIAALGIAAIAVREGINAWRGDPCCQ